MKFVLTNSAARFTYTAMVACVVLLAGSCLLPRSARALTVSPVRLELMGDPGTTATGSIMAINSGAASKTFYTNVETFEAGDETGNPTFRVTKSDLATWISIPATITLGPNEARNVSFTITVPHDAEPGGYFAAIFLTETPLQPNQAGQVTLTSQVGSLVLFRVNGGIREGVDILEFDAKNHKHWYASLPVTFYYRFQNSGQSWVKPVGDVIVSNLFRHQTALFPANPLEGDVLPQSIRRFENTWAGPSGPANPPSKFWPLVAYQLRNFAFGPYEVRLNLAYAGSNGLQGTTALTTVWVFPWQLLLVAIIAILIVFFLLRFFIRRYNRYIINSVQRRR